MKRIFLISTLVAVVSTTLTALILQYSGIAGSRLKVEHTTALPTQRTDFTGGAPAATLPAFTETADKVVKAVVNIKSTQANPGRGNEADMPDLFRDFFDRFDGQGRSPQPRVGAGSGVIINADGYIVTNNHVVADADDLEVTLYDNRSYKATVVGTDPSTDLAVIRIKENDLPFLPFVNSDEVRIGEWVLAVGNPFNLQSTVTAGIVSAKARNINIVQDQYAVESFIQTDAAINPGNSGGALVNLDGGLIGINTAIASPTGAYSGYGFAVPSNLVRKVVEDLMEYGTIQRGVLGILIRSVDGNFAREKSLSINNGIYVDSLLGNSAAGRAGVKPGDVITAVNGIKVGTSPQLQEAIAQHRPGDQVRLTVNRGGKEKIIEVTLSNPGGGQAVVAEKPSRDLSRMLGAEFATVDASTAKRLDISGGVTVKQLYPGKLRSQTQMRPGFIITKVNGREVRNVDEFSKAVLGQSGGVMLEGIYPDRPGTQYYAFGLEG